MIDFKQLASEYKTPLYIYDLDHMTKQYSELKDSFKARKSILCYAVKANSNLSVVKHFAKMGSGADCVSIGEVRRAFLAGIPAYKIIFSGVGKSDGEIREAIEKDILYINVESEAELGRVELIAKELKATCRSAEIVADLVRSLQNIKIELKFFDVGGGLGIKYNDEVTISPYDYAQAIMATLKGLDLTVICEPGRFLTANAGYFVSKVLYEKQNGEKKFVVIDGAMNDLLRPALYSAYHKIEAVTESTSEPRAVDIVGPVCESGDFFAKDYMLPELVHSDLIVVHSAGAYGFGMGSNYNTRGRSAEVALEGGESRLIRKRETFDDLIALEKEFLV